MHCTHAEPSLQHATDSPMHLPAPPASRHRTTTAELDGTRASQILAFVSENGLDDRPWVVLDDEDVTNGKESLMMQVVR